MGLQEPGGALMGTVQSPTLPQGDTLPYALAGAVPTATGSGWAMLLPPVFSVAALGTLATGTTTLNWAQFNFYTFTAYGGAFTIAFTNVTVGQQIQLYVTGAGSAAATWPSTISWVGLSGAAPPVVGTTPILTGATVYLTITCTALGASPTFVGTYITS